LTGTPTYTNEQRRGFHLYTAHSSVFLLKKSFTGIEKNLFCVVK